MTDARLRYERMLEDMRTDMPPQRQWGEGRGVLMVVGHFVVGVAAGAWLIGLVFASRNTLLLGYALGVLGGVAHLAFLAHPARFWRMVLRPATSWVSRGFAGLTLFLAGGFLYLLPIVWSASPWSNGSLPSMIGYGVAGTGMLILIAYMGFVYAASKAIPVWNSPLHPALYMVYALRGGIAALLLVRAMERNLERADLFLLAWIAATFMAALLVVLELYGAATSANPAARKSARELLAGRLAIYFYGGSLAVGIALPALFVWGGLRGTISFAAIAVLAVASAAGDFFMKYATVRSGIHRALRTSMGSRVRRPLHA